MPLPSGTRLGPYETQSLLGVGGMGEVYRARDTKLKRDVALKVLPEAFARDSARMARFQREAEVLASLNHPNIAHIYGVEDRALVMELVDGESPKGPLPFEEAWKIADQIAQALEYAHERGIVHRDLKPDNVKVSGDGVVKLLDFGLAKALSAAPEDAGQNPESLPTVTAGATVAGSIMGTPAYMAPEQAKGKRLDKRADIWAWGVMLHELLTGDRTFKGESLADTLAQVLTSQPDLEKVPPNVRRLLRRCLEKDPKQRLRDIGDARDLLDEPAVASSPVPSRSRFGGRFGWIAGGAIALIAIAALWAPWRGHQTPAPVARLSMELAPAEALGPAPFFARPVYTSMALSPDGKTLAFTGFRGRQLQLYKRALDQTDAAGIPGTDGASEPFFSPDGQWVGFFAGAKLRKVPMNGGPASDICETSDARSRAWGGSFGAIWPSANTIIFSEGRQGVMQVSAAGGTPQVLVKPDPAKQDSYRTPQLLPDGKTLLFTSLPTPGDWDESEIITRRLDSGEQHSLIKGAVDARYVPTGHLVYVQHSVLMAVPFDAKRMHLAGAPVAMLDGVMQSMYVPNGAVDTGMAQFAISQAGHLAYATGGVSPPYLNTIIRVDRKGVEQELKVPKDQYLSARVSPDGQKVAVVRLGSSVDIWLVEISSGNMTRFTSEGSNAWPLWSPDGKRILFSRASQFVTSAVDGNGSVEPVMTVKGTVYPASWSADGKWLAYMESARDGMNGIWAKPMSGSGEPTKLLESKFTIRDADFSPDGHWIVYTSTEAGPTEVYVQAFPGPGEKHRISNSGGVNPAWARNGRELFYLEPRGNKLALMAVDFAPNGVFKPAAPHLLFESNWATTSPVRSYDVTPDGKYFIAYRPEAPPDQPVRRLNIVLNWFEELQKRAPRSGS